MAAGDPTLDRLAARGAAAASDLIPTLPIGGTTLLAQTAGALQAFVLGQVGQFGAIDPTGAADSTPAFQAAIASGASFDIPPGVYKISANLSLNTTANHGQRIRGAGPLAADGGGTAKTVLRPTAAVTALFTIDGTGFAGYLQGVAISDLAIDMADMADVATSIAFNQVQAYDIDYDNVRVLNSGVNRLSWSFNTGSYTSRMTSCQGGAVRFNGTNINNAVTTITLTNCDILSVGGDWHVNVTLVGGAVQQPSTAALPISWLAPGTSPYAYLPNTGGLYVVALSTLENCLAFTSVGTDWEQGGGFAATHDDGTHGVLPLIRVLKLAGSCQNATLINPGLAGMYVLDQGASTTIVGQNLGAGGGDIASRPAYHLGALNVAGGITGFTDLAQLLNTDATTTFAINSATGLATFLGCTIQPAANGDLAFSVRNAATQPLYDFTTNGGGLAFNYGTQVAGYTDAFTTQSWNIQAASGIATFRGSVTRPGADGNSIALWSNAGGTTLIGLNTSATASASSLYFDNGITLSGFSDTSTTLKWSISSATGAVSTGVTTVAALPSAASAGNGARLFVTDATVALGAGIGTIVAGGGANPVPVVVCGGSWLIG